MMGINLPERCYCADVDYPMAIVGTAGRGLIVYSLENKPTEFKRQDSPLKYQHRAVAIFKDKKKTPTGGCEFASNYFKQLRLNFPPFLTVVSAETNLISL